MKHVSIGIAGTAKNTGKTTTTALLAQVLRLHGHSLGLTSIGYDGEPVDTLSGLPKPRHIAQKGDFVATAMGCLEQSLARVDILAQSPCATPLGPVMLARVKKEGLITLVGPNKASDVRQVIKGLHGLGVEWVLCDGALNRIAPLAVTDGLILATGASRSTDFAQLALETSVIAYCLSLKQCAQEYGQNAVLLFNAAKGLVYTKPVNSLLTAQSMRDILAATGELPENGVLVVPGVLSFEALEALAAIMASQPVRLCLVAGNSLNMLMTQKLGPLAETLRQATAQGLELCVQRSLPLLACTINPVYHAYDHESGKYHLSAVDPQQLYQSVAGHAGVTTLNVVDQGAQALYETLLQTFSGASYGTIS